MSSLLPKTKDRPEGGLGRSLQACFQGVWTQRRELSANKVTMRGSDHMSKVAPKATYKITIVLVCNELKNGGLTQTPNNYWTILPKGDIIFIPAQQFSKKFL